MAIFEPQFPLSVQQVRRCEKHCTVCSLHHSIVRMIEQLCLNAECKDIAYLHFSIVFSFCFIEHTTAMKAMSWRVPRYSFVFCWPITPQRAPSIRFLTFYYCILVLRFPSFFLHLTYCIFSVSCSCWSTIGHPLLSLLRLPPLPKYMTVWIRYGPFRS